MAKFRLKTPADIQRTATRVANAVNEGTLNHQAANAIINACNAALQAIKRSDEEKKDEQMKIILEGIDRVQKRLENGGAYY